MTEPLKQYSIPTDILQAMVNVINSLPAGQVRPLLNAIESVTQAQDSMHEAAQKMAAQKQATPVKRK
jgi:hypothetical protein